MGICLAVGRLGAQDYHAIQGSNYAGSLGVSNNPASMLNTPYSWDVTVAGIQAKYQTNAVRIYDYSLLSSPAASKYSFINGQFARNGRSQANLNLLNARVAWGRTRAIALGANIRSFANISTSEYNYADTITSAYSFFSMNEGTGPYDGKLSSSNLLEFYLSYGQTLIDRPAFRLNGGLTAKINRGLAGLRTDLRNISHTTQVEAEGKEYYLNGGDLIYGYSSNFDYLDDNKSGSANTVDFLKATRTGFSMDVGLELLIKPQDIVSPFEADEAYYDYDWKISASVLDLGWGQYRYGVDSRKGSVPSAGVNVRMLDNAIDSTISSVADFTDSLSTILPLSYPAPGDYKIFSPARLVLNLDRWLTGNFYLNAELSINVSPLLGKQRLYQEGINLFRLTPRWETRRWGVYMPVQYNYQNRFWVGLAGKAGPLLIGFHNLGNLFSKTKMASGGGYIAIVIRPARSVTASKYQRLLECPPY